MHRIFKLTSTVLVTGAALVCVGCGGDEPAASVLPEAQQVYAGVHGKIVSLETSPPAAMPLTIRHEAIPDFVGSDGTVYRNNDGTPGMKAMVMPFPEVAPDVSMDGFAAGDVVAFDLSVAWNGTAPTYWISGIEKLPADTELDFGAQAQQPSDAQTTISDALNDPTDADPSDDGP
jgi:hypothetical protein